MTKTSGLIADIGATNARFALVDTPGQYHDERVLRCTDYPGLVEAARAYLAQIGSPSVISGAFAVAGPVFGDHVDMTNHPWSFSVEETRKALGLKNLAVMNDFRAVALGVPHLVKEQVRTIGPEIPARPFAPIGIIGPGTGLGVASLVWGGNSYIPVPGEGGSVTAAAQTRREFDVLETLRRKYRHVSVERVCSGKGLVNLYEALRTLEGRNDLPERSPEEISKAALNKSCPLCIESLTLMLGFLANASRNLALTIGAFGGVYIAGGICLQLGGEFFKSDFHKNFIGVGRFEKYLEEIPTYMILHPYIAFVGLANEVGKLNIDT